MDEPIDPMEALNGTNNSDLWATNISTSDTLNGDEVVPVQSWVFPFMASIYACIFGVGVTGNVLVILVIARDRRMRNTANYYLISLSVADLMIIVCCLPVAAYEMYTEEVWNLGSALCRLAPMLQYLSTNASIFTMLAISIERYIVICRPFKVRSYCTKRRAVGIIIILWAFSFVCSFPLLAMDFTFYGSVYHDYLQTNVTVCYIQQEYHSYYFFCHQAFFYVLPGLMLSLLYLKIIWTLQEFKGERFGHSPDSRRNTGPGAKSQADTSQQLIVMLSTVVLCYFVCLFPYNFVMFISLLDPELLRGISTTNYQLLLSISRIMFYVNSCSNPILYNAISGKFRNAFLRLFCPARYKSAGRDSRTLSVRGSADYDYDDRIRFDEQRNRRCTKKTIRSGSDLSCRTGLVRWEQRELCDPGVNCQRRATDGVIRRTRQNRERRTTEPIPFDASRDIRPEIEESSCVVEASLVGADMPLL